MVAKTLIKRRMTVRSGFAPGPDLPPIKEPSEEPDLDPIKPVQEPMRDPVQRPERGHGTDLTTAAEE
jgi:hypothetical protein